MLDSRSEAQVVAPIGGGEDAIGVELFAEAQEVFEMGQLSAVVVPVMGRCRGKGLAPMGPEAERLEQAFDLYLAQKTEYSEQHAATAAFEQAWKTAHETYMRLVRLGRILFRDDHAVFVKLTLNEERKRTFSGWLAQANTFFSNLLSDQNALAKYDQYNTPPTAINAAKVLVDVAEQANIIQAKETGEAQQATKERDGKMDALDSAMSEFYALAELACEDAPELLEMLDR